MYPFERFSRSSKRALTLAQEEAEALHRTYIGPEHLLLGLVGTTDGRAARVLATLGVRGGDVRREIQARSSVEALPGDDRQPTPTSRVKRIVEMSFEEARRMGSDYVDTDALLIAMLIEGGDLGAQILNDLGATLPSVRHELEVMGPPEPEGHRKPEPTAGGLYPAERFSNNAKRVLALAQEEADSYSHSYIGTEHLLLGLLGVTEGTASQLLGKLGVDGGRVRRAIEGVLGRSEPRIVIHQITPTSRVKKVIELALDEAHRTHRPHAGTADLLNALLIEGEGIAAHILEDFGVTVVKVRTQVEVIGLEASDNPASSQSLPLTDGVHKMLAAADRKARTFGQASVTTEHVLLGLLHDPTATATLVLKELGVAEEVRSRLTAILSPEG